MSGTHPLSSFADQRRRWGDAVDPGLLIVPNILLRYQHKLKLDTVDLVLILNIVDFWEEDEGLPSPRLSVLATRIGRCKRTVERAVTKLTGLGYLKHCPSEPYRGKTIRRFDLSGLVLKLQDLSRQDTRHVLQKRQRA
ncbi:MULTISPECIES: helix-turn-helix domain-containing protein [Methylobacteriaceae]|uniref:helix-turn-helix domain-containing protein n=1 Tax=Methylobacteriaceae TaxID=119045 RepID=UPI002F3555BE